jgi:hypothetical protein
MSKLPIDREILQRMLDRYFELSAESSARLELLNEYRRKESSDPAVAHRYVQEMQKLTEEHRNRRYEQRLAKQLADEDAAAFLAQLATLFPRD